MKPNIAGSIAAAALILLLSACAPAKLDDTMKSKSTAVMFENPTKGAVMDKTETPELMHATPSPVAMGKPTTEAMMEEPAWFGAALTNVNDGKKFTVGGFKGKVTLVETMAQWCPTCKKQAMELKSLREKMGMPADLVTVSLDIDPNEKADTLKAYTGTNGFDWIYAVAPAEVSREIGKLYSDQFLNPPSTPILIIDRKGDAHPLPFGVKSADDLMKAVEPYLKAM